VENSLEVVCLDCDASYEIVTEMDTTQYTVTTCSFCGSESIEVQGQELPDVGEDEDE